jgi:hypothetical protein
VTHGITGIPEVGYLTKFDIFVLFNFIMLFICCILHQLIARLRSDEKVASWPLRRLYISALEATGRIVVIPTAFGVFTEDFAVGFSEQLHGGLWFLIALFLIVVIIREYGNVSEQYNLTITEIVRKCDNLETMSTVELLVMNLIVYHKLSGSREYRIADLKRKAVRAQNPIESMGRMTEFMAGESGFGVEMQGTSTNPPSSGDQPIPLAARLQRSEAEEDSDDEVEGEDDGEGDEVGQGNDAADFNPMRWKGKKKRGARTKL